MIWLHSSSRHTSKAMPSNSGTVALQHVTPTTGTLFSRRRLLVSAPAFSCTENEPRLNHLPQVSRQHHLEVIVCICDGMLLFIGHPSSAHHAIHRPSQHFVDTNSIRDRYMLLVSGCMQSLNGDFQNPGSSKGAASAPQQAPGAAELLRWGRCTSSAWHAAPQQHRLRLARSVHAACVAAVACLCAAASRAS